MSYPLLSDPGKVHDITDDLESVFWVLLFCAMHYYSLPDQDIPMDVFDYQSIDEDGRRTGGNFKAAWVFSSSQLLDLRLTSADLHHLLRESQKCWLQYHTAMKGATEFDDMIDVKNRVMKILE